MKTFHLLRADDLKKMLRLVSSAHDLCTEPVLWKEHVLRGLCELVDGKGACCSLLRDARIGGALKVVSRVDECWGSTKQRAVMMAAVEAGAPDPMSAIIKEKGQVVTRLRRQIVSDEDWYGSMNVQKVRQPAGVDDCIISLFRLPQDGWAMRLAAHRPWGGRRFAERERVILHALHEELGGLYEREMRLARMFAREKVAA